MEPSKPILKSTLSEPLVHKGEILSMKHVPQLPKTMKNPRTNSNLLDQIPPSPGVHGDMPAGNVEGSN